MVEKLNEGDGGGFEWKLILCVVVLFDVKLSVGVTGVVDSLMKWFFDGS